MATGLAHEDSDVDIAIQNHKISSKEQCFEDLNKIRNSLITLPYISDCNAINAANVPVVKMVVDLEKLGLNNGKMKVDITIDDSSGLYSIVCFGIMFTEWVIEKLEEYTHLKALLLLLKRLLSIHGYNNPYYGGIKSFTLTLMLTAFLNTCPPLPSAGHYFIEVLRYYGHEFKSDQMAIIQGQYILISSEIINTLGLIVMDPYFPNTNAAANVTQFEQIRELFVNTYEKFNKLADNFDPKAAKYSILDNILCCQ